MKQKSFLSLLLLLSLQSATYSKSIYSRIEKKTTPDRSTVKEKTQIFKTSSKPGLKVSSEVSDVIVIGNDNNNEFSVSGNPETFSVSESNGNLTIKEHKRSGSDFTDIIISAPAATSLNLESKSGSISVEDIEGIIDIESKAGKVTIKEPKQNVTVRNASGDIVIKDPVKDVTVHTKSGSVNIKNPQGTVSIDGKSGDIVVKDPNADVSVTVNSGNIDLHAKTLSSSQKVTLETSSGNITCTLPKNAQSIGISTTSGSVQANGFNYGTIRSWSSSDHNITLTTTSGKVRLKKS